MDVSEGRAVHPLPATLSDGVVAAHPQRDACGGLLYHTWQATTQNLIQESQWTVLQNISCYASAATTNSDNPVFRMASHPETC